MSDFFRIKKITDLNKVDENTTFPTSDFASLTQDNKFVQLEYVEEVESKLEPYKVHPGIWAIQKTMQGLKLYETSFTQDSILESFVQTKDVVDKVDCFFERFHVYKKRGIEIPIRRMLLFGPAGGGKSTCVSLVAKKYNEDKKTATIIWHTDKFEAHQVKDFIKSFEYIGVEKVILVVEDIGGVEQDKGIRPSESSLLSLLDNQEKTFIIPTMIIATTNHPENFLGNLTNRPGRFADKIKIDFPSAKAKQELLKFFAQDQKVEDDVLNLMGANDCKEFTVDHLKELFIRSDLYNKTLLDVTKELIKEIKEYNNSFSNKNSKMGFMDD